MTTLTVTISFGSTKSPMVFTGEAEDTLKVAARVIRRHYGQGGGVGFDIACDDATVRQKAHIRFLELSNYAGPDDRTEAEAREDERDEHIESLRRRNETLTQELSTLRSWKVEHESRLVEAAKIAIQPGEIKIPSKYEPILVREFFDAAWPDRIMDRTLFEEPIRRGLPRLLELILQHGLIAGTMRITNLAETLAIFDQENAVLRRTLAWLAWRPEVPDEVRALLAQRIRNHDVGSEDTAVAKDTFEEGAEDYIALQGKLALLCDLIQEAVDANLPESPIGNPGAVKYESGGISEGRVRHGWTAKMDALADYIRARTLPLEPVTLAEIREIKK